MSKIITISLDDEYIRKIDLIANNEYSDRSKLVRKWIDENIKGERTRTMISEEPIVEMNGIKQVLYSNLDLLFEKIENNIKIAEIKKKSEENAKVTAVTNLVNKIIDNNANLSVDNELLPLIPLDQLITLAEQGESPNKIMKVLGVDWVSQESVGDCKNPDEPNCNGDLWRFTFKDGSVMDICRDCNYTKIIRKGRD